MLKESTLKTAMRSAVVASVVLGATVAAQATVITYTSSILSGVGTGSQMDTLPKFNPMLGTLTSVTVSYADFAFSESSITNLTTKTRLAHQSSHASDTINVSTGVTINVGGTLMASTLNPLVGTFFHLGAGSTSDIVDAQFGGGSSNYSLAADLAEFTGPGTLSVTNQTNTGGSAIGQGSYYAFTNNFAEGQASVSYNYNAVPSPAAAATMFIGIVGGLRRRRNA